MTKEEYKLNLRLDKVANNFKRKFPIPHYDYIWNYLRLMSEYSGGF